MSAILNGLESPIPAVHDPVGPFDYNGGLPFKDGLLAVSVDGAVDHYNQGLGFTAAGLLAVTADAIDHYQSGAGPISAVNQLCITLDPPDHFSGGVGYNATNFVSIVF